MEFRMLGSLEVLRGRQALRIDAHKPRALLALLLLHANEIVASDRLIEDLWSGPAPTSAEKVLQTYIWQLRKSIGQDRIVTRSPGYLARVEGGELDLERFELLRASGRPHEALALWRGEPLADFAYEPWARAEIARLEEARVATLEERVEADLDLGRHASLVGELEQLVERHPLRERLRGQLMLALYRCGRQAEALEAYRNGRRMLVEELGLEPSAALQHLEAAILRQDAVLEPQSAGGTAPGSSDRRASAGGRFIGRAREMTEIVELVSRERLVTLTGPGGVGKTRLALEVLRADAPRRRDGAVCVELAAIREPELVASTILRTLGLPESRVTPPADALAVYVRGRQLLLLLDNFEQVLPAAPLVADLLAAAPRLAVLVTSRAALHLPGEARYEVPTLRLPEATDELALIADAESVALFMQRAAATRADFRLDADNAGVVAELCSRLDGLPLALELAGARVDLLSPAAILSRLGRRLDLLKTAEAGAPDRHSTLRAAIQWSHDLLDEDQRALFSSLAVFAGGFSADGVEAVAAGDALDGLAALIDASLIRRERPVGDEPRFAMLETIREYALERLAERRDGDDVRHRHAVFYAGLAAQAEPGLRGARQTTWLKRIDADRENIRAALSWAEESGDAETGLRTAASLWRYWQVRGELAEPCRYLERLLEHAEDVEPHLRAPASFAAGRLAVMHGDREAARRFCEASFALYQELGDTASSSFALAVVAMATQALGDSRRAREVAEQAVTLARESGDWWSVSVAVSCLGDILYAEGDLSAARRCLEEAVRAAQEVGDSRNIARCENILAAIALEQNHYPRAMRLLEDALAIQRDLDDRWGIARTLTNLGIASEQAGDADAARARFEDALAIQLESDDQPGIAASLECLAALAARRGRLEQAASVYGAAAVLREMVGAQRSAEIVRRDREDAIAAVADALDDEAFADAWSAGRSMTLDEAIAYAREASAPTSTNEGSAQDVTRTLD